MSQNQIIRVSMSLHYSLVCKICLTQIITKPRSNLGMKATSSLQLALVSLWRQTLKSKQPRYQVWQRNNSFFNGSSSAHQVVYNPHLLKTLTQNQYCLQEKPWARQSLHIHSFSESLLVNIYIIQDSCLSMDHNTCRKRALSILKRRKPSGRHTVWCKFSALTLSKT